MSNERFESRVIISGIGQSETGRRLDATGLELTVNACRRAIADAGLEPGDIDGLATWPGEGSFPLKSPGFEGPGIHGVQDALRFELDWYLSANEGGNVFGSLIEAAMAVASGLANNALVFRTVTEARAQAGRRRAGMVQNGAARGSLEWLLAPGAVTATNWAALLAQAYFHHAGVDPATLGWIPVVQRVHAARNPKAVYTEPLSFAEYQDSRVISSPLRLYDCDAVADGSTAVVISRSSHRAACDHPVLIDAVGTARRSRPGWFDRPELASMAAHDAAAHLWRRSALTPRDLDFGQLYDGYSFFALMWLEAAGVVAKYEATHFIEGGDRIKHGGAFPINTGGGQLSGGRLMGFGLLHEACLQLTGRADGRQLARSEVGLVTGGGGPIAQAITLTRA